MSESGTTSDGTVRLRITPQSDFYAEGDERLAEEAFELQQAFQRELPETVESRPVPGEKGVVTEIVIPLISGGALTSTVEIFKAWLAKRPTNRKIELEFELERGKDTSSGTIHLDATNVDDAVLDNITKEVFATGK
jgi:hypothetical protein